MILETERLIIKDFEENMAKDVHLNSLEEDVQRFIPDEYFPSEEDALDTIKYLISQYDGDELFVHPIFLKNGENIGYVQLVKIPLGFEVGYHIAKRHTKKGYASEALKAFMKYMMDKLNLNEVYGICLYDNYASRKVLGKCGFNLFFQGEDLYHGENNYICKFIYKK